MKTDNSEGKCMTGNAENKDETLNNDPGKNRPQKTRTYISDYKKFFFFGKHFILELPNIATKNRG